MRPKLHVYTNDKMSRNVFFNRTLEGKSLLRPPEDDPLVKNVFIIIFKPECNESI